jgi:glycerophosphoryl diester phosphodiesterase
MRPHRPHRALLSAHRAAAAETGVRDNTREALEASVRMPVEFVEFDVHRTSDGQFVLTHDREVTVLGIRHAVENLSAAVIEKAVGHTLVRYEDALRLLVAHDKKAHIDFKFVSPAQMYMRPETTFEVQAAATALSLMGSPESFILTTMEDISVDVLTAWTERHSPGTLVGLSLGRDVFHRNPFKAIRLRLSEVFPGRRFERCRANLVVVNWRLADLRVLRWASKQGLPVLVWTVDGHAPLAKYLNDHRVWMVTTNHPSRAPGSHAA